MLCRQIVTHIAVPWQINEIKALDRRGSSQVQAALVVGISSADISCFRIDNGVLRMVGMLE